MNKKALNQNMNYVTANLVATYDLCALSDPSVKYIDYLCVYEYEYEGKIYKYREHKKDNFSPIPETLELVFRENPSDVHKVKKTPSENNDSKSTSSHWCVIFLVCFLGLPIILVICAICHLIKFISEVEFSEINILPILNFSFF